MTTSEAAPCGARESMLPKVVIVFGISLTIAWIGVLGFALIRLIGLAI